MTLLIFCSKPGNPREGGSRAKPGNQLVYIYSSNAARRYDDGCHVSRPLLLVACSFMTQDADTTTACSSAVSTHVGVL